MNTNEIVRLTRDGIANLLGMQHRLPEEFEGDEHRQWPRWPFPGTIEFWPVDGDGTQQWFGTIRDVSEGGIGCITDKDFASGTQLDIAFHLPEASFYGKATVCHCSPTIHDQFMVGMQFDFVE